MEVVRRKGWFYQIERDKKGRIKKFEQVRRVLPIESINLLPKTDGKAQVKEEELVRLFREWLRESVPRVKQDGERWYIVRKMSSL